MRSWHLVSVLVAPIVLAACGSSDEPESASSTTVESLAATSPSSATGAPAEAAESSESPVATNTTDDSVLDDSVLVVFEVSGGFRGRDDRLVLSTNGEFDVVRGTIMTTGRLPPADVSEIEQLLSSSGLFERPDEFVGEGADLQVYVVTYDGVSIVADDTGLPAELVPVIDRLEAVLTP